MRLFEEMIPDEVLLTEDSWDAIIGSIKRHYQAFLDVDLDFQTSLQVPFQNVKPCSLNNNDRCITLVSREQRV